jgi:hypothetical protein
VKIERTVTVEVEVRTVVPAEVTAVIDYHGRVFRAALIEERLHDGRYTLWISGPIITTTGREHGRQRGQKAYYDHSEVPSELAPLVVGADGLRAQLSEAAGGEGR